MASVSHLFETTTALCKGKLGQKHSDYFPLRYTFHNKNLLFLTLRAILKQKHECHIENVPVSI